MTTRSRILLAVASLALGLLYVLPLWKISLEAPQYPEGLGMYIWIDTVTGTQPNDLTNINNLNHYIGMKRIEPDAIPELEIMPWVIGLLALLGLGAAAGGRRWMLYAWVGLFLAVTVVGLVDFYLWEYDYGHNLDEEHAIIKVPGMNYQPPLIGSKQLLNFTAHSWPAAGGWIAFASFGLGLLATYWEVRGSKRRKAAPKAASLHVLAGVLPLLVLAAGCTPGPKPIAYGHDPCAHCLMTISDERYGAELVTETGKVYPFDSVECLAAYAADHPELDVHSRWVTDFRDPTRLIPVEAAFFLHSPTLRSPMGMNLTAFGDRISEDSVLNAFSGEILDWAGVVSLVARGVPVEGAPAMTHGH